MIRRRLLTGSCSNLASKAIAVGTWFLMTLEQRMKRGRVLEDLHELRSFAHVVDMHQLTKDPTQLWKGYSSTASSQVQNMTEFWNERCTSGGLVLCM